MTEQTGPLAEMPPQIAALVAPLILSFQTGVTTQVTEDLKGTINRLSEDQAREVLGLAILEVAHLTVLGDVYRSSLDGIREVFR